MECRKFEITLISARNLVVEENHRSEVYAKILIAGNPSTKIKTPADGKGGANPKWNFTTACIIGKQAVEHDRVNLVIKLYCRRGGRRPFRDKYIGEVSVSFKQLFNRERALWGRLTTLFSFTKGAGVGKTVNFPVKNDGSNSGVLKFSYKFGEVVIVNEASRRGNNLVSVVRWVWLIITLVADLPPIQIPFSWEGVY